MQKCKNAAYEKRMSEYITSKIEISPDDSVEENSSDGK